METIRLKGNTTGTIELDDRVDTGSGRNLELKAGNAYDNEDGSGTFTTSHNGGDIIIEGGSKDSNNTASTGVMGDVRIVGTNIILNGTVTGPNSNSITLNAVPTIPAASGTLITTTSTNTLTNKTLTTPTLNSPEISNIRHGNATFQLPTGSGTLALTNDVIHTRGHAYSTIHGIASQFTTTFNDTTGTAGNKNWKSIASSTNGTRLTGIPDIGSC